MNDTCIHETQSNKTLMTCPYNYKHKIAPSSFVKHIGKCAKNVHPSRLCRFKKCKYNSLHIIWDDELEAHQLSCAQKQRIESLWVYQDGGKKIIDPIETKTLKKEQEYSQITKQQVNQQKEQKEQEDLKEQQKEDLKEQQKEDLKEEVEKEEDLVLSDCQECVQILQQLHRLQIKNKQVSKYLKAYQKVK